MINGLYAVLINGVPKIKHKDAIDVSTPHVLADLETAVCSETEADTKVAAEAAARVADVDAEEAARIAAITAHAGEATVHQDAPALITTGLAAHAGIATAHQDAPALIATHTGLPNAHHTKFTTTEHDVVARHPLANLSSAVCSETEADGKISDHAGVVDAHHTKSPRVKVKTETRDVTAGSGDVAYTGYGFTPSSLLIIAYASGERGSVGVSAPDLSVACVKGAGGASYKFQSDAKIVVIDVDAGVQEAIVKTYDADGFTLTWTKISTPDAGTAYLKVIAME